MTEEAPSSSRSRRAPSIASSRKGIKIRKIQKESANDTAKSKFLSTGGLMN